MKVKVKILPRGLRRLWSYRNQARALRDKRKMTSAISLCKLNNVIYRL
jgi:hypothetical protein